MYEPNKLLPASRLLRPASGGSGFILIPEPNRSGKRTTDQLSQTLQIEVKIMGMLEITISHGVYDVKVHLV